MTGASRILFVVCCLLHGQATIAKDIETSSSLGIVVPSFDPNLKPEFQLMVSGGPTNPLLRTQRQLLQPTIPMHSNKSLQFIKEIKQGIQYLFQTSSPYVAAMAGTASTAFEAALDNLIERGDSVLIPLNGFWPQRALDICERLGAKVKIIQKDFGSAFTSLEIQAAILLYRPKVVFTLLGDSASGLQQRINGVGDLCILLNCYIVADAVGFAGVQPLLVDLWKIDVAFCNSQKGIGSITGLAPIVYSRRAVKLIRSRKTKSTTFLYDINVWIQKNYWLMNDNPDKHALPLHTVPVVELYALREALRFISYEGLENIWLRHSTVYKYMMLKVATELPQLEYFVKIDTDRLISYFVMKIPDKVKVEDIIEFMSERHAIDVTTGLGSPSLEKTLRFALFGPNAQINKADKLIEGLKDAFNVTR